MATGRNDVSASDSQADQPQDEASSAKFDWRLVATLIALVAAGLVSVLLILGFADNERSRELRSWQEKLSLIAESRAQAVETWLATQRGEISELAGNTTVQLFLTDLKFAEGELSDVPDAEGQLEYVNNLFLVAGGRSGFYSEAGEPAVAANLDQPALAGLALLDGQSRVLLTTPAFDPPPLPSSVVEGGGGATLAPLRLDRAGRPVLTAAARVAPLQSENVAGEEVGYVVGRKPVLEPLRALLRQPGPSEASLKIQLLQQDGAGLRYVLPRSDEEGPLSYTVALDTPESAAAYAYLEPRGFATRLDSQGEEVLVTGRRLEGAPWMVMVTVDRGLALGPSEERIRMLIILLFLLLAFVAAVIAFVWRHGASRRARDAAMRYKTTARELEDQRNLLRLVTDNQPTAIFTLDREDRYRFANRKASQAAGVAEEDLIGKPLDSVLGPAVAAAYLDANEQVRKRKETRVRSVEWEGTNGPCCKIVTQVPIGQGGAADILIVEYDISEEMRQRRQQERSLNDLVMTLVGAVDRRDPYAANHSRRVAQLAEVLAEEMQLDEVEVETARISGSLMNLGKILVPEDLLTKEGSLTPEELEQVREAQQMSADLLEGVAFRGKVAETLRQSQEHVDGSGQPAGLIGGEILVTARILAAANAFVGMVSPRSYRASLPIDTAVEELLRQSGKHFDQRVVAALLNYLENKGGREIWRDAAVD